MAINHKDLDGFIEVTDFALIFSTAALSADKQKVVINYVGYGYPELSNVEIDTYEYSLDNGSTWTAMTPSGSTQLTSLAFSEAGTAHTFEWMAKEDEGMDFYNTNLRVRFNAISGVDSTGLIYTSYVFERGVTNLSQQTVQSPFPDSYAGESGWEITQALAPRV
jgi:hypothetical protein